MTKIEELKAALLEAETSRDQLWKALMIVSEASGDFTQNVVNDALYDVGYYVRGENE